MPLLGRLFTKKNKIPPRAEVLDDDNAPSPTFAPTTESNDSTVSSYVTPDISVPSQPNAKNLLHIGRAREQASTTSHSSSGGGLRLFRRKKSSAPGAEFIAGITAEANRRPESDTLLRTTHPRPSDAGTDPTDLRRLRPPPSRSAIFAAYADPGSSLSTRSLPESTFRSSSPVLSPSPSPAPPQKRPSFFAWAKPSSRSSSNTGSNADVSLRAPSESSDFPPDFRSFNLKSFRHIGSVSPPPLLPNQRDVSMSPPIPRPRGSSLHSDSSQRISVAAFREAQARRSQTGSPAPTPIDSSPPSTRPVSVIKPDGARPSHGPRPSRSSSALLQNSRQRRSSIAMASTDEDDSSSGTDSEGESVYRGKRPGKKAQSELGHGSMVTESSFKRANALVQASRPSRSHLGHGVSYSTSRPLTNYQEEFKRPELPRRSQSSLGLYENTNKLVVASITSLNSPAVGHKRNSSVSSNVTRSTARKVTPPQVASNQQTTKGKVTVGSPPCDSDSDSEDNAPLASLIAPKRPGSATSFYSNPRSVSGQTSRSTSHAKPLIDVNEVISSKPISVSLPPPSGAAFTQGPTLLSTVKASTVHTSSPLVPNAKLADDDTQPLARRVPPMKFASTPSSPANEMKELMDTSLDEKAGVEKGSLALSQNRESSLEQQKRDPLSDRLSRAVKKSLTNPTTSGTSSSPPAISKTLEGPTSRLSIATSSESLHTRQSHEAARITLPRSPPPIVQPSKDEYSPPDEDLAELLGSVGIKLISRTGEPDEVSNSESSEEEKQKDEDRIAPIPIKQRTPPPAFAVTSRPAFPKQQEQSSKSGPSEVKGFPGQLEQKTQGMSRPSDYPNVRQRSSSAIFPSSSSSSFPSTTASPSTRDSKVSTYLTSLSATDVSSKSNSSNGHTGVSPIGVDKASIRPTPGVKQKSNTLTSVPLSSQMPRRLNAPERRFATIRGDSPSSSTGDSSSVCAPHTPRDSGEICVPEARNQNRVSSTAGEWNRGASGLGIKRQNANAKRRSVSFEDDIRVLNPQPSKSHIREAATGGSDAVGSGGNHVRESARAGPSGDLGDEEEREKDKEEKRKARRRQETQAAIELGNVMHGPPPVLDDDNNDMPTNPTINPRMSGFNPMMVMNPMSMPMTYTPPPGSGGWVSDRAQSMLPPTQFMIPRPSDPNLMAAHQQAMMVAKQAYQMAVAQQAMAAAAEEWERGSALGGFGSGGSVYGGAAPLIINTPTGMMPMPGIMPGMQGNLAAAMWSGSSPLYGGMGSVPRFGNYLSPGDSPFSGSRSDHGGHAASSRTSGNWNSSKSMYGESFVLSNDSRRVAALQQQTWSRRDSMDFPPVPPIPASKNMNERGSPEPRGPSRLRTVSQPVTPTRSTLARKAIPPSSWRPSGS